MHNQSLNNQYSKSPAFYVCQFLAHSKKHFFVLFSVYKTSLYHQTCTQDLRKCIFKGLEARLKSPTVSWHKLVPVPEKAEGSSVVDSASRG